MAVAIVVAVSAQRLAVAPSATRCSVVSAPRDTSTSLSHKAPLCLCWFAGHCVERFVVRWWTAVRLGRCGSCACSGSAKRYAPDVRLKSRTRPAFPAKRRSGVWVGRLWNLSLLRNLCRLAATGKFSRQFSVLDADKKNRQTTWRWTVHLQNQTDKTVPK